MCSGWSPREQTRSHSSGAVYPGFKGLLANCPSYRGRLWKTRFPVPPQTVLSPEVVSVIWIGPSEGSRLDTHPAQGAAPSACAAERGVGSCEGCGLCCPFTLLYGETLGSCSACTRKRRLFAARMQDSRKKVHQPTKIEEVHHTDSSYGRAITSICQSNEFCTPTPPPATKEVINTSSPSSASLTQRLQRGA